MGRIGVGSCGCCGGGFASGVYHPCLEGSGLLPSCRYKGGRLGMGRRFLGRCNPGEEGYCNVPSGSIMGCHLEC